MKRILLLLAISLNSNQTYPRRVICESKEGNTFNLDDDKSCTDTDDCAKHGGTRKSCYEDGLIICKNGETKKINQYQHCSTICAEAEGFCNGQRGGLQPGSYPNNCNRKSCQINKGKQ